MNAPQRHRSTWRLVVAYHGKSFCGWQKQLGVRTVQEVLEGALQKVSGGDERVICRAAGRTDSGVHARGQLVAARFATRVPSEKMLLAMASQLPDDVVVTDARVTYDRFDPRRHSIGKRYVYRLHRAQAWDPFDGPIRWHIKGHLDVDKMQQAAKALVGEHDYESFRATNCDAKHARRFLWKVSVTATLPLIEIEVRGNAFCRNMVRIIAGTLVDIGRGRLPADAIPRALEGRDRTLAGVTAPAEGLTLEQVYLPDDVVAAGIPEGAVFPGWPPTPPDLRPWDDNMIGPVEALHADQAERAEQADDKEGDYAGDVD